MAEDTSFTTLSNPDFGGFDPAFLASFFNEPPASQSTANDVLAVPTTINQIVDTESHNDASRQSGPFHCIDCGALFPQHKDYK
jgi:hypothetical protein